MIPIVETGKPREKVGEFHPTPCEQGFEPLHRPPAHRIEEQAHLDTGPRPIRQDPDDLLGERVIPKDVVLEVDVVFRGLEVFDQRPEFFVPVDEELDSVVAHEDRMRIRPGRETGQLAVFELGNGSRWFRSRVSPNRCDRQSGEGDSQVGS